MHLCVFVAADKTRLWFAGMENEDIWKKDLGKRAERLALLLEEMINA
jgi:hypothetical protein